MNDSEASLGEMSIRNEKITEGLTLRERRKVENLTYQDIYTFLTDGIKKRLRKLERRRGKKNYEDYADLQADYAFAMDVIAKNETARRQLEPKLKKAIYGDQERSVIRCLGDNPTSKDEVYTSLLGPTSVLTMKSLVVKANPELEQNMEIDQILPEAYQDTDDKIDLILDFGDKRSGRDVLRLIQLKSIPENEVYIEEIIEPKEYLREIKKKDSEAMLDAARRLSLEGYDVRCFAVLVPQWEMSTIDNIFGTIPDEGSESLVESFKTQAESKGLLPKVK